MKVFLNVFSISSAVYTNRTALLTNSEVSVIDE